jgi:hypothetical protein
VSHLISFLLYLQIGSSPYKKTLLTPPSFVSLALAPLGAALRERPSYLTLTEKFAVHFVAAGQYDLL